MVDRIKCRWCGPAWNNTIRHVGISESLADAARAVIDLVGVPCSLRETTDSLTGETRYSLESLGARPSLPFGWTARVLASNTAKGVFVADA